MILCTPVIYEELELEGPCGKFAYGGAVPQSKKARLGDTPSSKLMRFNLRPCLPCSPTAFTTALSHTLMHSLNVGCAR